LSTAKGILSTVFIVALAIAAAARNSSAQNGETWKDIAKRYRGQPAIAAKLVARIREGSTGAWGKVAMTPHPDLTDAQCREMVTWILSLKDAPESQPAKSAAGSKLYTYKPKIGPPVQLDFPLFIDGNGGKVSKDVFRGYELFNSYCYRCHGTDATGSQLGPDLRHSLAAGMKERDFLSVAMAGRKDKGMPSWAGFLTKEEVTQLYQYTKGRSLDLVPAGRPASGTE
jgi:cytochrome c